MALSGRDDRGHNDELPQEEDASRSTPSPPNAARERGAGGAAVPREEELAALVAAARAGDTEAFHGLVSRFERLVYKIAWHKCRDHADTEDLAQEIFLHAFRSLPSLRDPRAFTGWLISLCHNRANRFCRRRRRNILLLEEARRALVERGDRPATPETLPAVVRTLPDEFRLALVWKYLDGCSYEEIGMRLSMSFNQVDYLLRRAKTALRAAVARSRAQGGGA